MANIRGWTTFRLEYMHAWPFFFVIYELLNILGVNISEEKKLKSYLCRQIRGGEHPGHHLLYEFHSNQTGSSDKVADEDEMKIFSIPTLIVKCKDKSNKSLQPRLLVTNTNPSRREVLTRWLIMMRQTWGDNV